MCEDLIREHVMGTPLTDDALLEMAGSGIDQDALSRRWQRSPWDVPRLDRVVFPDERSFEFARYPSDLVEVRAMTFLVHDENGDPIDIAAWAPQFGRLATWYSRGALLGAETLFAPRMTDAGTLEVFRSPADWLRNACRGVVILDAGKAAPLLRRAAPLAAEDVAHGSELKKLLEARPPRILVPAAIERRTA